MSEIITLLLLNDISDQKHEALLYDPIMGLRAKYLQRQREHPCSAPHSELVKSAEMKWHDRRKKKIIVGSPAQDEVSKIDLSV
ncbi:hypothetical protein INR49_017903 [Caranx melampygus]|nr:hypothetical protein INR49_017903 [Caranx melampygus]